MTGVFKTGGGFFAKKDNIPLLTRFVEVPI